MQTHTNLGSTTYQNTKRYDFLNIVEDEELPAYADSVRIPTIGIGLNLRVHGRLVLEALGFDMSGTVLTGPAAASEVQYVEELIKAFNRGYAPGTGAGNAALTAFNRILQRRANDATYPAGFARGTSFELPSTTVSRQLVNQALTGYTEPATGVHVKGYEEILDRWLTLSGIGAAQPGLLLRDNYERLALLSLAFNSRQHGTDNPKTPWDDLGLPTLLGRELTTALLRDDRAEAWFQIRYRSGNSPGAERRFLEADTFGLFDQNGATTDLGAKAAFRTYTRHRELMDAYESDPARQIAINEAVSRGVQLGINVLRLPDALQPARDHLRDAYFVPVIGAGVNLDGWITVGENDGSDGGPDTRWYRNDRVNDDIDFDLRGSSNNDLIFAESGNDRVRGGAGRDVVYGGSGHDILQGDAGNDYLEGGFGDDTYYVRTGDGQDEIRDSDGSNTIVFGGTPVTLLIRNIGETSYHTTDGRFTAAMQGDSLLVTDSQTGASTLLRDFVEGRFGIRFQELGLLPPVGSYAPITDIDTSPQLNTYTGTAAAETTTGSGINDDIFGFGGGDYLLSGAGDDRIEAGGDTLPAVIDAGVGRDVIVGSNGNDRLIGGPVAGDAEDAIQGGGGEDYIEGGGGDDLLAGGAGRDILVGGEGDDSLRGAASMVAVDRAWAVDRSVNPIQHPHFEGDIYDSDGLGDIAYGGNGRDLIVGGGGDDVFYGENGEDSLTGNGGNDLLSGGDGFDTLDGGYGNDRLFGGDGDDFLFGEGFASAPGDAGNDYLDGGEGADTAHGSEGNDTVLGDVGEDYLYGESGTDMLLGGADADHLFGGGGSDLLYGDDGDDWLQGGDGTGSGDADDVLIGGIGVDTLLGEEGDDVLIGGEGNDQLVGGAGADILDGGTGNDTLFKRYLRYGSCAKR